LTAISPTGIDLSPILTVSVLSSQSRNESAEASGTGNKQTIIGKLTSIHLLWRLLLLLTSIILGWLLRRKPRLGTWIIQIAPIVHSFLQRIGFPAKHVVAVRSGSPVIISNS
jgi:cell division inhibitor SulA